MSIAAKDERSCVLGMGGANVVLCRPFSKVARIAKNKERRVKETVEAETAFMDAARPILGLKFVPPVTSVPISAKEVSAVETCLEQVTDEKKNHSKEEENCESNEWGAEMVNGMRVWLPLSANVQPIPELPEVTVELKPKQARRVAARSLLVDPNNDIKFFVSRFELTQAEKAEKAASAASIDPKDENKRAKCIGEDRNGEEEVASATENGSESAQKRKRKAEVDDANDKDEKSTLLRHQVEATAELTAGEEGEGGGKEEEGEEMKDTDESKVTTADGKDNHKKVRMTRFRPYELFSATENVLLKNLEAPTKPLSLKPAKKTKLLASSSSSGAVATKLDDDDDVVTLRIFRALRPLLDARQCNGLTANNLRIFINGEEKADLLCSTDAQAPTSRSASSSSGMLARLEDSEFAEFAHAASSERVAPDTSAAVTNSCSSSLFEFAREAASSSPPVSQTLPPPPPPPPPPRNFHSAHPLEALLLQTARVLSRERSVLHGLASLQQRDILDVEGAQRVLRRLATMTEPPTLEAALERVERSLRPGGEGEDDSNSDNCDEEGNNENKEVGELDNMIQEEVGNKEHLKDDESNCVSQESLNEDTGKTTEEETQQPISDGERKEVNDMSVEDQDTTTPSHQPVPVAPLMGESLQSSLELQASNCDACEGKHRAHTCGRQGKKGPKARSESEVVPVHNESKTPTSTSSAALLPAPGAELTTFPFPARVAPGQVALPEAPPRSLCKALGWSCDTPGVVPTAAARAAAQRRVDDELSAAECIALLGNYLVALTASDCSILITFRAVHGHGPSHSHDENLYQREDQAGVMIAGLGQQTRQSGVASHSDVDTTSDAKADANSMQIDESKNEHANVSERGNPFVHFEPASNKVDERRATAPPPSVQSLSPEDANAIAYTVMLVDLGPKPAAKIESRGNKEATFCARLPIPALPCSPDKVHSSSLPETAGIAMVESEAFESQSKKQKLNGSNSNERGSESLDYRNEVSPDKEDSSTNLIGRTMAI